jgi:hypothetical protein
MAPWRCPHCATPQAETSRCWVCQKPSNVCLTCRNFRRAVADRLGFCSLDRGRSPLRGDEIRECWDPPAPLLAEGLFAPAEAVVEKRPVVRRAAPA